MKLFSNAAKDVPAGLVVFLVAVPLCLGIALASDASVFSGLIAGVVGGIVVGLFSNSSVGVSGPAAGLTAIVAAAIHQLGDYRLFLLAVVLAGAIQIIMGIARLGVISSLFPNVVIKGMLSAIGLIIILKQIPHAVGYDPDFEGDEAFFQPDGHNTFSELLFSLNGITVSAALVFFISLVLMIAWERKFIQSTFLKFIPGPLVAVLAGICYTLLTNGTGLELVKEHKVALDMAGKSMGELFLSPDFSGFGNGAVWTIALTLAVVASVETLLSVDAADKLDPLRRTTSSNRELFAQGIGNIVSGMIGGLPVTQVVVRTSANVNSGGLTKLSTIVHGVLILVAVFSFPTLFSFVPLAALAAVLIMVGYKLAKPSLFVKEWKSSKTGFLVFTITILAILFTDLLKGIGVGMFMALLMVIIERMLLGKGNLWIRSYSLDTQDTSTTIVFESHVSFLAKIRLQRLFSQLPEGSSLTIDYTKNKVVSPDINELIAQQKLQFESRKINYRIIN